MKKTLFILLAVLLLTTGCSSKPENNNDNNNDQPEEQGWVYDGVGYDKLYESLGKIDLDLSAADGKLKEVLDKGYMVVATSPDYPPMEFIDLMTNEPKGADLMVAKFIANSLGVELKIETMEFEAVITAVDTGKADIALSGFGYREDRAELYELTHGYDTGTTAAHHTLLVPKDKVDQYNSLADFAGKTVYAQSGSLQEGFTQKQLVDTYGVNMVLFTDITTTIGDLMYNSASKEIDAIAFDSTTAINYANNSDGTLVSLYAEKGIEFELTEAEKSSGNVGVIKKGEISFLNAVNECIDYIVENGLYQEMYYAACDASGVDPTAEEE